MAVSPQYIASLVTGTVAAICLFAVLYSGFQSSELVGNEGATLQVASAASKNKDTGGRLGSLETEFDMGVISNKETTVKRLTIENTGSGTLEIKDVRTSCGCTKGYFQDRKDTPIKSLKIAAGESAELFISVDPFRVPGFDSRKSLTLFTNDSDNLTATFDVVAKVEPEFAIEPEQLHLGEMTKGDKASGQAVLRQLGDTEFDVNAARAGARANETYTVALTPRPESQWRTPGKREWTIDVELDSNALRRGLFRDRIYIETDIERLKTYSYMLNAEIQTFYSVIPEMLHRRDAVDAGTTSVTSAVVSADQPIRIENLKSSDPDLVVTVKQEGTENSAVLDLGVTADAKSGVKNARLTFTVTTADGNTSDHSLHAIVAVK